MEKSFSKLESKLSVINPKFVFEFSPVLENGKREFVLSADGHKDAFSDLIYLYVKSPFLKKWDFVLFKQGSDVEPTIKLEGDFTLSWEDVQFEYKKTTAGLSFDFYIKGYTEGKEKIFGNALIMLMDSYIGEYDAVMQTYSIGVHPLLDSDTSDYYKFKALKNVVESYKRSKREE